MAKIMKIIEMMVWKDNKDSDKDEEMKTVEDDDDSTWWRWEHDEWLKIAVKMITIVAHDL